MTRDKFYIANDCGLFDRYLNPAMVHMMKGGKLYKRIEKAYNQMSPVLLDRMAFPPDLSAQIARLNELGMKNLNTNQFSQSAYAGSHNLSSSEKCEFAKLLMKLHSDMYFLKGSKSMGINCESQDLG